MEKMQDLVNKYWGVTHSFGLLLILVIPQIGFNALGFFGIASFAGWIISQRKEILLIKPLGGYANWVTFMRLLILVVTVLSGSFESLISKTLFLVILILDGLDGFLARKFNASSSFGASFDMEVDAFFTLCLSIILREIGYSEIIVLIGAWRYVYVLFFALLSRELRPEPISYWKKSSTVFTIASMILGLFWYHEVTEILLLLALAFTSLSFVHSIYFQLTGRWIHLRKVK